MQASKVGVVARRQAKRWAQARFGWDHERRVSFVFGCQRSGTKLLLRVLDNSPSVRVWHEDDPGAFDDFQLRDEATLRRRIRRSPAPVHVLKPICDSQRADELLASFPSARGLWTVRRPAAVARSAVAKWGEHQREVVDGVVSGEVQAWGWRARAVPPEVVEELRAVWRRDLTPHEGALLFWYLRNRFFFALGLDSHPRMLLVRYEDLTSSPQAWEPVFLHVGLRLDPAYLARVQDGPVKTVEASEHILALCEGLWERLSAARGQPGPPSPVLLGINTLGTGGAERYVVTVANWLAEQGSEVTVSSSGGELTGDLLPQVRHEQLPLRRVRAELPVVAAQLRALLLDRRPQVVVANSLVVTWVARMAGLGQHLVVVNVAHGWPEDRYSRVGPLMRAADHVVAVSPQVRDKLVAAGLDPERCSVVYNGVDMRGLGQREGRARQERRAELGASDEQVLVLTLGRLTEQKAHQHVIALARALRERRPELRWAIVGTGDRDEELQELVREQGVQDRVRLMGLRSDAPELLGSADIYLNCSNWEGMPLSTIEAMASELPIVATRTEGCAQLLDSSCGLVVDVGDVPGLAEAISRLAEDPGLRREMGLAARSRAFERFSHQRMARELSEVLLRVSAR